MKIGAISDTHGYFDPKIPTLFAGVDHILHGGDIGPLGILQQLESIAPVTAVLGNTDSPLPGIRETEFLELNELRCLLHHIVNPAELDDLVRRRLELNQPNLVVFGHTHQPFSGIHDGVHFFNPGYAGRQRFNLRRSVAILSTVGDGRVREEWIWL